MLKSEIAGGTRTTIRFKVILDSEPVAKTVYHSIASICRPVVNNEHLQITVPLQGEALNKFLHLLRPVIDGNNDGVFGIQIAKSMSE
jgi:hypothetical protein